MSALERQELERLEASVQSVGRCFAAKTLEYFLKDDSEQEDVLAAQEAHLQLLH